MRRKRLTYAGLLFQSIGLGLGRKEGKTLLQHRLAATIADCYRHASTIAAGVELVKSIGMLQPEVTNLTETKEHNSSTTSLRSPKAT